jgi:hypothetical protein
MAETPASNRAGDWLDRNLPLDGTGPRPDPVATPPSQAVTDIAPSGGVDRATQVSPKTCQHPPEQFCRICMD